NECGHELFVSTVLNKNATGSITALPSTVVLVCRDRGRCILYVCIASYNNRGIAAKLEYVPNKVLCGHLSQLFSYSRRTGKRHDPYDRGSKQRARNLGRVTEQNLQGVSGQARVEQRSCNRKRCAGRLFRGLENHWTASDKRRR